MNPTAFKALADAFDRQFQQSAPKSKLLPPVLASGVKIVIDLLKEAS